jgi:hypothetical protein
MEVSLRIALGVLAVATCMGGVSDGSISDDLVNSESTIDFGSSEAAVLSVGVPLTSSAALARLTLPTPALPIAVGCGVSVSLKSAVRNGATRSRVGAAVFSMPAEPKPANQATPPIPHKTAVIVADRRGFMTPISQRSTLSQLAQPSMRSANFLSHDIDYAMAIAAVHRFSQKVLPVCDTSRILRGGRCGGLALFRKRTRRQAFQGFRDALAP